MEQGIKQLKSSGEIQPEQENLLRVRLAIADYLATKQKPPESLEVLVPRYFDSVPQDTFSGKPFLYTTNGVDFTLDIPGAVSEVKGKGSGKGEPSSAAIDFVNPNTVEIEEFTYDPSGKRNPFQPFDLSPKIEIDESLPPLQRYDLGQLRVSAVLSDSKGEMFAMVEDATGRGYPVRVGDIVGNKGGKVVNIDPKEVHVLETVTDFTGETKQTMVPIKLVGGGSKKPVKKSRKSR